MGCEQAELSGYREDGCRTVELILKPRRAILSGFSVPNSRESEISFAISRGRAAIQRGVLDTESFVALIGTPRICSVYPVVEQF